MVKLPETLIKDSAVSTGKAIEGLALGHVGTVAAPAGSKTATKKQVEPFFLHL